MSDIPPTIPIAHDEWHAKHIGRLPDGRQFFLTTSLESTPDEGTRDFVVLYTFDADGKLLDAQIDDLGVRGDGGPPPLNKDDGGEVYRRRLESLDGAEFGDIRVAPFRIERFGIEFGPIPREPDEDPEDYEPAVELMPGNTMAFFEPWDGEYDT